MNDSLNDSKPSKRTTRQNQLRYMSWATVILGYTGLAPALFLFAWATVSCWGASHGSWWCEIMSSLPWLGLALWLTVYAFILWIIHEISNEQKIPTPVARNAWRKVKQGYKNLDRGHHRMVRRVHRVSSIAFAGFAAYISFQYFETDTLINIAVASIAYVMGEVLNWQKFSQLG